MPSLDRPRPAYSGALDFGGIHSIQHLPQTLWPCSSVITLLSTQRCMLADMIQRRFPRYKVNRPLRAMVEPRTPSTLPLRGRCLAIGEGGLDAILPEHLAPGKTVYLELAPALKVCAVVRNRRSFHYGFEFIQMNEAERVAIKELCESYPPSRQI
jgi:PilZ domain